MSPWAGWAGMDSAIEWFMDLDRNTLGGAFEMDQLSQVEPLWLAVLLI